MRLAHTVPQTQTGSVGGLGGMSHDRRNCKSRVAQLAPNMGARLSIYTERSEQGSKRGQHKNILKSQSLNTRRL